MFVCDKDKVTCLLNIPGASRMLKWQSLTIKRLQKTAQTMIMMKMMMGNEDDNRRRIFIIYIYIYILSKYCDAEMYKKASVKALIL